MGKLKNKQNGFGALAVILVLVIVGVIGFVGWFVWHSKQVTDKNLAASSTSTPAFKKNAKTTAAKTTKTATSTTTSTTPSTTSAPTVRNAIVMTKTDSTLGSYLADSNGYALYTIGSGSTGVSACTGSCLTDWPIYQDKGSTTGLPTNVGTIKRSDTSQIQYTYKGLPLYYFTSDSQGQITGDNVVGFKVAKP